MSDPSLDQNVLNSLLEAVGGDRDFLNDLISTFLQDAPLQLSGLNSALADGNSEEFRRAAHSLKSNSAYFGAVKLQRLCKQLEEFGKGGDLSAVEALLREAEAEYALVKSALEALGRED